MCGGRPVRPLQGPGLRLRLSHRLPELQLPPVRRLRRQHQLPVRLQRERGRAALRHLHPGSLELPALRHPRRHWTNTCFLVRTWSLIFISLIHRLSRIVSSRHVFVVISPKKMMGIPSLIHCIFFKILFIEFDVCIIFFLRMIHFCCLKWAFMLMLQTFLKIGMYQQKKLYAVFYFQQEVRGYKLFFTAPPVSSLME